MTAHSWDIVNINKHLHYFSWSLTLSSIQQNQQISVYILLHTSSPFSFLDVLQASHLNNSFTLSLAKAGFALVSRGQPLPLDEGRVWSTDVDLFVLEITGSRLV